MEKTLLKVGGMSCGHCKASVEKALKALPGVVEALVNLEAQEVAVEFDSTKVSVEEMKKAITEDGYEILA